MKSLNVAGQALQARRVAGEKIPIVDLVYLGLTVPQRWAVCGLQLVWGGYTWAARDVRLSDVQRSIADYSALQITLPAIADAERALAFADVEGAPVEIYRAWVDPQTGVVADAILRWAGELDLAGWQDGAEAYVHFGAESRAALALTPKVSRYTNDEQQRINPGDTCFDFDPATDAAPLVWPAASYWKV